MEIFPGGKVNKENTKKYNIGDMFVYEGKDSKAVVTVIGKQALTTGTLYEWYVYTHHYIDKQNDRSHISTTYGQDAGFDIMIKREGYSYFPVIK